MSVTLKIARFQKTCRSLIEASAFFCAALAAAKSDWSLVICSDADDEADADSATELA
jgi:hypothetical protein